jgi:hypothetical protein
MNTEEFAFLADHVSTIDGRRPERLAEVQNRIRVTRRRRAAGAIAGTATLAAAVVAVAAVVPRSGDNSGQPINEPTSTLPTVQRVDEPAGQTEISADFGPQSVVQGNVAIGSTVNDPGETELHANLPYYTPYASVSAYCRGSSDIWWVANGNYGQCSPDAALEPTPPLEFQPIGNAPRPLPEPPGDQELSVDMVLTGPLNAQARECIADNPDPDMTSECLDSNDVALLKHADATFGFTAYVHSAPNPVHDPFGDGFEALANLDGVEYLFTYGVVSAPGADTLASYLDISEQPRLVLLIAKGPGREGALLVDGERASFPTDLAPGSAWRYGREEIVARTLVPPGSHNVTVDLAGGRRAAVLVYEAGQL